MITMNALIITFGLVLVATLGAGYDFQDSYFNQYLAADINDLYYESVPLLHPRSRRDEEAVDMDKCRPHRRRPKLCCGQELIDEFHDSDAKRECFKEVFGTEPERRGPPPDPFSCKGRDKHRAQMTCIANCVAQKKNLLDSDGNVKEEELKNVFKGRLSHPSWTSEIQEDIIATCLNESKNIVAPSATKDEEDVNCNPAAMALAHCLFREVQLQCPNEVMTDKISCDRFRERVQKDGDMMMGPPPPPPPMDD